MRNSIRYPNYSTHDRYTIGAHSLRRSSSQSPGTTVELEHATNDQIGILMSTPTPPAGRPPLTGNVAVAPRGVIRATLSIALLLTTMVFVISLGATLEALAEKYLMGTGTSKHEQFLALFIPATGYIGAAAVVLLLIRMVLVRRKRTI